MAYIGKSPTRGVRQRYIYTATGSETSISASDTAKEATGRALSFTDGAYVDVYKNGVLLEPNEAYNTNTANTIAGLSSLSSNDVIEVIVFDIFTTADAVSAYNGGTFSGAVTFDSRIIVDDTTQATTTTDGSIQTDGGLSVAKDIVVGDDIILGDNIAFTSDGAVLYFGVNSDVTVSHIHNTGLLLNSSRQLQFGDSGTYIHQSADGVLDLVADVELELNGALVDINSTDGNVDISASVGNVTLTGAVGDMTFTNNGTGDILLGNFKFDSDQTVGSGQDDYVLTYNHSTGKIGLEEAAGGGVALDDITAGDAASTLSTTTGDISVIAQENIELRAKDSTTSIIWQNSYDNYYPKLKIYRASYGSAPQAVGKLSFNGTVRPSSGSGDTESELVALTARARNATTGEEDGDLAFTVKKNGSMKTVMSLDVDRTDWPHDGGIELGQDMDICWIGGGNSQHGTFLTVADGNPYSATDDSTIVLPSVNGTVITTGNADNTGFNGFTTNVRAKTADGAILYLQRQDYSVYNNNVLGGIEFSAPAETQGGLGAATTASMHAEAKQSFSDTANNTDFVFKLGDGAAPSEKVRFKHTGNVEIPNGNLVIGTAGKGIDFSNATDEGSGETTTSSILDDYEEGSFSVTEQNSSVSMTVNFCNYTKIGRAVHFIVHVTFGSGTDSSPVQLSGMPFDGNNGRIQAVNVFTQYTGGILIPIVQGTTIFMSKNNATVDLTYTDVANKYVRMSGTYQIL